MISNHTDGNAWVELTPGEVLRRWPLPSGMMDGLSATDERRAQEAYARLCLDGIRQYADHHGRCPEEISRFIAEKVAEVMGQLIHEGEMRGTLH